MNTEVLGVIAQIVLMVVLSYPLGKYIAKVYKGEKTWSDFMKPVERVMFKLSGINPNEEMNWKQFLRALLVVNLFWFLWGMVLLVTQGVLPLNPDGNVGQTAHQAFNTCISFMVNCNLQHYSGESGLTYIRHHALSVYYCRYRYGCHGRYNESAGCKDYSDYWQFLELFGIKLYPCPVASFIGRRLYPDCARNSDGL